MGNIVTYEVPEIVEAGTFRDDTGFKNLGAPEQGGYLPLLGWDW